MLLESSQPALNVAKSLSGIKLLSAIKGKDVLREFRMSGACFPILLVNKIYLPDRACNKRIRHSLRYLTNINAWKGNLN